MDKINKIKIKDVTYEIGGGGSATVDSGLSTTSENAVQNKVITSELEKKLDKSNFQATINSVVYAEPDTASSAHTFTRTINGEKLYTTDNANRDIKLVTSVNGKTGAVNIQAKTINGESVLGEGEIDMSSYQTKTEAVKIARLTQAQYDALSTKDNNTLYIITDAQ